MQVDAIAVELRPRPMWEAADLGVRLVQAHARSVWRSCAPVYAVVLVLALATVEIAPWLPGLIIFWLKPWLDRSLLFVLSRAVFGQETRAIDLWQAQRAVWWRQLPSTLLWRRLSPWRSFTQPIYQLEGQRGPALRQRRTQLLRNQRGAAGGMHFAFANVEAALTLGLGSTTVYATAVAVLEPFYVAAGFAMYLNRRVQLEAWDIEQEFRRAF